METESLLAVNPVDLKAVFDFFRPYRLRAGKHGAFTVTPGSVEAVCLSG